MHWTFLLLSPLFTAIAFIVQLLHVTNVCLLFPAVFFFFHFVCCVWSLYAPVFFPSLSPQTPAGRDRWLPLPEPRSARGFFLFKRKFVHIDDCCRLSTQILFEIELNQTEFIFFKSLICVNCWTHMSSFTQVSRPDTFADSEEKTQTWQLLFSFVAQFATTHQADLNLI